MPAPIIIDAREMDRLNARLEQMKRVTRRKVVRQSMRKATKPVLQDMKNEARSMARKGRKSTRKKGAKSLMRIIAGRGLKLRATKRSRKHIGFRILIALRSADLMAMLGRPLSAIPWYPAAHVHFGFKRGSTKVPARKFMQRVADKRATRWYSDFADHAQEAIEKELRKP